MVRAGKVAIPGLGEVAVSRPTHGQYDAGLIERLARFAATVDDHGEIVARDRVAAAELCALVANTFRAIGKPEEISPLLERLEAGDVALAVEAADALSEAIDVSAAIQGQIRFLAGVQGAQCRLHVLQGDGTPLRPWADCEERPECSFQCPEGRCVARDGVTLAAERILRDWKLCGGARRTVWLRAGGLEDQDAATVYHFQELDGLAALAAAPAPSSEPAEV